ncbi:MAG: AAA family ATPase, partial [Acidobacteriota bacterium]|nr:AAA family ATPase [Acidobacteriota bacterium]
MSRLELRLLGGFEARLDDVTLAGFESQKARALLAYLSLHRTQALDRDFLAGLLWGERSDESARRNLRQALYSIRTALSAGAEDAAPLLLGEQRQLRLNPDVECWTDVQAFEQAYAAGSSDSGPDPRELSTAAGLYKGDFLAGFFLRDSPGFEDWLISRQEELREEAVEVFRTLVSVYLARGEHRYGIRYARRLLSVDPLSEEAHRQLMRLYAMAGRRPRALAQYEHLLNLLHDELGVAPMEETTALYRSILLTDRSLEEAQDEAEPPAPLIPLVGRSAEFAFLQREWEQVLAGHGRVTSVVGEAGIGKSRLVKSFVDSATSKREAIVLRGSCHEARAIAAYRPITELVGGALNEILPDEDVTDTVLESPYVEALQQLAAAAGQAHFDQSLGVPSATTTPSRLAMGLLQLIGLLCNPRGGGARPMIVLLEDLQWADSASLAVIGILSEQITSRSVWMLLTTRDGLSGGPDDPPEHEQLVLGRLAEAEVEEISSSLVELASIPVLTQFLLQRSEGLPLKLAELVNLLWDEGKLHPRSPGAWELRADPSVAGETELSLPELIQRRIRALPTSARRLLAMAA